LWTTPPIAARPYDAGMTDIQVVPFLVSELRLERDERDLLDREWWPSYAHAVIHRDGVFLFDNGVGLGNAEIEATFHPRVQPLERTLAEHGISLADVTGAANCHLHFDHAGQNGRLPGTVPIFVQRPEWAMVHQPDYTVSEWIDVPGLRYEVIDGEVEVASGLRLIPTPGHSPGHQSLCISTAAGVVLLAGQALQSRREWEGSTDPRASGAPGPDPAAYATSVARLRALNPVRVHFAHDPEVWTRADVVSDDDSAR
jgi:N-acyl homoserine lactone hydrolase